MQHEGSQCPNKRSNLWAYGFLATGLPGSPRGVFFVIVYPAKSLAVVPGHEERVWLSGEVFRPAVWP